MHQKGYLLNVLMQSRCNISKSLNWKVYKSQRYTAAGSVVVLPYKGFALELLDIVVTILMF